MCGVYSFGSSRAEAALLTWTVELVWVLQLPRTGERRVNRDQESRHETYRLSGVSGRWTAAGMRLGHILSALVPNTPFTPQQRPRLLPCRTRVARGVKGPPLLPGSTK